MSADLRDELRQVAAHLEDYDGDYENAERVGRAIREHDRLLAENERLREALAQITEQHPKTVGWLRRHEVVFDGPLGRDPKNFEHVAFSIYTDLCEADSIARAALAAPSTETDA